MNVHLHGLVLDSVYRRSADGEPVFVEAPAPTDKAPQAVLPNALHQDGAA